MSNPLSEALQAMANLSPEELQQLLSLTVPKTEEAAEPEPAQSEIVIPEYHDPISTRQVQKGRRPNLFEGMKKKLANDADVKRASKADKNLWKDREPETRDRPIGVVAVKCGNCSKTEHVPPGLIFSVEGERSKWLCNACIPKAG